MEAPRACELQPMRDASWAEPREARARGGTDGHMSEGALEAERPRGIGGEKRIFLFLVEIFLER